MAIEDVTASYVNLITYNRYTDRTSDSTEFTSLKNIYSLYLNSTRVPDAKYTHGLALLIAHYYALDPVKGDVADQKTGNLTTEKVGDLSEVRGAQPYFGEVEGWKLWLSQTRYGAEFIYLMKTFKTSPSVL